MAKDKKKQKKKDKAEKAKAKALKLEKRAEAKAKDVVKAAKEVAEKQAAKASKQAAKLSADAKTALQKASVSKAAIDSAVAAGKHSLGMQSVDLSLPNDEELAKLSAFFKIFADPTRLRILYALAEGPKCVADIASAAGVTQGATSHQLRSMKQENLVDFERDGKQVIYSLADDHVQALLAQGYSAISE